MNPREAIVIGMRAWSLDLTQEIFVLRRRSSCGKLVSTLRVCDVGMKSNGWAENCGWGIAFNYGYPLLCTEVDDTFQSLIYESYGL